jgi:hypothetical protein
MENTMNFGEAITALKKGEKVSRMGWNGKGMFLFMRYREKVRYNYFPEITNSYMKHVEELAEKNEGIVEYLPTICMKTAANKILNGWLASQIDMLAEDWVIVE